MTHIKQLRDFAEVAKREIPGLPAPWFWQAESGEAMIAYGKHGVWQPPRCKIGMFTNHDVIAIINVDGEPRFEVWPNLKPALGILREMFGCSRTSNMVSTGSATIVR